MILISIVNHQFFYILALRSNQLLRLNESEFSKDIQKTSSETYTVVQAAFGKIIVPEPMDLIPKSVKLNDEPIRTGATIAFVNLERFAQGKKLEMEKLAAQNGAASTLLPPLPITPLEAKI